GTLHIETRVGLESALKLAAFESRRAETPDIDSQPIGQHLNQQGQRLLVLFVLRRRADDLQPPPVKSKTRHGLIQVVGEEMLIGLPTHAFKDDSLFRQGKDIAHGRSTPLPTS